MNPERVIEDKVLTVIKNIRASFYKEIIFVLSTKFGEQNALSACKIDFVDKKKCVLLTNSQMFNYLSKLGIYTTSMEKDKMLLKESDIKTDKKSCDMRIKHLSSLLLLSINSANGLKVKKIEHKNVSDDERSRLNAANKLKQEIKNKLINEIKKLKVSYTI